MNPRRGTTSSTTRVIKKNREENPAYILLNNWSEISNKIWINWNRANRFG